MIERRIYMAALLSRPARGGWIEIKWYFVRVQRTQSRPARGGGIEIVDGLFTIPKYSCPAPHGAGGLKSYRLFVPV